MNTVRQTATDIANMITDAVLFHAVKDVRDESVVYYDGKDSLQTFISVSSGLNDNEAFTTSLDIPDLKENGIEWEETHTGVDAKEYFAYLDNMSSKLDSDNRWFDVFASEDGKMRLLIQSEDDSTAQQIYLARSDDEGNWVQTYLFVSENIASWETGFTI